MSVHGICSFIYSSCSNLKTKGNGKENWHYYITVINVSQQTCIKQNLRQSMASSSNLGRFTGREQYKKANINHTWRNLRYIGFFGKQENLGM